MPGKKDDPRRWGEMDEQAKEKSTLARLVAVVGILGTIATIIGVAWTILHKESNEVPAYQSQVIATCEQIHKVLATEHNEMLVFGDPGGAASPEDSIHVRKDLLLQVMENNLAQAKSGFAVLNQRKVPSALAGQHQDAVEAQNAWFAAVERVIKTVKDRLPRNARLSNLQELGIDITGSDPDANVRLNSAMTALAGRNCQVTA